MGAGLLYRLVNHGKLSKRESFVRSIQIFLGLVGLYTGCNYMFRLPYMNVNRISDGAFDPPRTILKIPT